jgi:hypothetical protein
MDKICILIRVYNRIEDLTCCIDIIRDTWKAHDYYLLVVANGRGDGYVIPERTTLKIDRLVEVENNIGHFTGNSQLLIAGLPYIPSDFKYTLILEADTWMYGDEIVTKYIAEMKKTSAVWASAQFFRYVENLATDFALIDNEFLKANTDIFIFSGTPEYYVANYINERNHKYVYITENMPVNLPRYIKNYPFAPTGRFFVFEKSKMVTHHIELIKNGMEEKKHDFNMVSHTAYFPLENESYAFKMMRIRLAKSISMLFPYKGWFVKRKKSQV